jgi:hypothetical protein
MPPSSCARTRLGGRRLAAIAAAAAKRFSKGMGHSRVDLEDFDTWRLSQ